jgi:phosphatidylglycerophosphate synthase
MPKRVSHSLLDPYVGPPIKRLYRRLPIPTWYPPEGIILVGHLSAIAAAFGLAYSTSTWWGGLLASLGVLGNHTADSIDGTHARATNQCRNGGELLDHFTDPLSFSYWLIGWGVSIGRLDLALAAVVILYATALLTSIKAKLIGEFTLASFGPTEFKAILVVYGLVLSMIVVTSGAAVDSAGTAPAARQIAYWFYVTMLAVGVVQLVVNVVLSVRDVNRLGSAADATEWEISRVLPEATAAAQQDHRSARP